MKRVKRAFAAGARVYAAGAEVPDDHPAVKASPGLFESVPAPAKPTRKGKAKADEKKNASKDDGDADGDT